MKEVNKIYKNKRVAITGASGYISSTLIDVLGDNCKSILLVTSTPQKNSNVKHKFLVADIKKRETWEVIIKNADLIFHLAGNTSVYNAIKDPLSSLESTMLPIEHFISVSQQYNTCTKIIYSSTASIYGIGSHSPIDEFVSPDPQTIYDLHKLFAEKELLLASKKKIIQCVILRISNVYGPSKSTSSSVDRGVLNRLINQAVNGENVLLYGGGEYLRDYIYIEDVAKAFLMSGVLESMNNRIFNLASGERNTIKNAIEIAINKINKILSKNVSILNVPWPSESDDIERRNFVADISAFKKIGWTPQIKIEDGIDLTISHFINNKKMTTKRSEL